MSDYFSRHQYISDGSTDSFVVPFPYISKDHVKVYVNGGLGYFRWNTDGSVRVIPQPVNGDSILLVRETSKNARLVDYVGNASLGEVELDTDSKQAFYLIQEQSDVFLAYLRGDSGYLTATDSNLFADTGSATDAIIQSLLEGSLSTKLANQQSDIDLQAEAIIKQAVEDAQLNDAKVIQRVQIERLEARVGNAEAFIEDVGTVIATETSALADRVTTVETSVAENTASIQQQATSIDGLKAQYTVKLDVNGYVSGFGLATYPSDDQQYTSEFIIRADKFAVVDPSDTTGGSASVPFLVDNGVVYINGQEIAPLTVGANQISANAIGVAKLDAGEIAADIGNFGSLTGGTLKTAATGYRVEISKDGDFPIWYGDSTKTAENAKFYVDKMGNAVFKGQLQAASGTFAGELQAAKGTFAGDISAATGTFSGGLNVKSATSGARLEIRNNVIKVYDENNVLRVKIGDLSA